MIVYLATHPCVTMPLTVCQNGGECTMHGIDYACKCAPGWSGTNCQIKESMLFLFISKET